MRHALTITGWLLFGGTGGALPTIYDTEKDCAIAAAYIARHTVYCVPDADEVKSWQGKRP